MTREEALKEVKEEFNEFLKGTGLDNEEYLKSEMETNEDLKKVVEANRIAIEALEQEPILDKIRAEIEQLPTKTRINWDGCCPDIDYPEIEYIDVSKNYLLSIIDKYKVESEE